MRIFAMIISKELLSFLRSVMLVLVVIYSFTLDVYIAGAGIQIKPRNVVVGYVDETGGGNQPEAQGTGKAKGRFSETDYQSRAGKGDREVQGAEEQNQP